MFKKYDSTIKEILSSTKSSDIDWERILKTHKEMILNIQHERLVHLLVTIFTGTVMSLSFFFTILTEKPSLLILDFALLALFIGYIIHYRFLENTTQNWYKLQEEIEAHTISLVEKSK